MRIVSHARRLPVAPVIALMLIAVSAIGPTTAFESVVQASVGGPPTSLTDCDRQSDEHATDPSSDGAPSTGPDTAFEASDGQTGNPLWCISGVSGGHAPDPATTGGCG